MVWRVAVGTLLTLAIVVLVTIVGVNEPARMAEFDENWQGRSIEAGAKVFQDNCVECHGVNGAGIPGVAPALNTATLFDGTRTGEVAWAGSIYDFVESTVSAGRPVMSEPGLYAEPMPTWSQEYGGPLRPDQVQNVVDFVMNWEAEALAAADGSTAVVEEEPAELIDAVGTDLNVELPEGDPERGSLLFNEATPYGCMACHSMEPGVVIVGPSMYGYADRAGSRIEGYDAETYTHESIVNPSAYLADNLANAMPANFGDRMTAQDLADLIAYLLTLEE